MFLRAARPERRLPVTTRSHTRSSSVSQTVGEFFVQRLKDWGVRTIFGFPGDGINGVLRGLEKAGDEFVFVQARHEEMAAFMASAYAKFSGDLGVCLSTGGPGATHLITGLYDAKLDHAPVLAITGQASRSVRGAHYQQELNLDRAFADVCDYVQEGTTPQQVGVILDRAIRTAKSRNAVTAVVMPNDLSDSRYEAPTRAHGYTRSGVGYARPHVVPHDGELRRAAELLNAGQKVALLVGAGALRATDEVIAVADRLQAGAAKALLGKAALPDDLPWVTGTIGLLGSKPSSDLMNDCDTLLMIGTGFPWSEFLPRTGQARAVQIDIDPTMLGIRYPTEVNLHGDCAETLRALLPLLEQKSDTDWRDGIANGMADWWKLMEERALEKANPVNPQRVTWELSPRLPGDVIVTSDSGSCANWYARDLRFRRGMMCSLSGGLASMGAAVPYAIGAKFAHPDRPVIALVGDGAMQMNNMAELITVAKYWRTWSNPKWICCVWHNDDLNQVTWEQRVMEGFPKFEATQQIPSVPYHRFAGLIGLKGIYVDDPERMGAAWDEALAADVPVVLEVKTDPEVPPLPPHITFEQAKNFMSTLQQGDPDAGGMLKGALHQVFASITPDRK
jgi:pyruvate dehydrogenase (quinone)